MFARRPFTRLLVVLAALTGGGLSAQSLIHVDSQATGAADGSSWVDAYPDLQVALAAAQNTEIWVAAGTYHPAAAGNQAASFQLKSGVQIYGGFSGTESSREQRDPELNATTLSGDIDQNDVFAAGREWWRPSWNFNAGNSAHVVDGSGVDQTARLDGFHIVQGRGAGGGFGISGAGLFAIGGDPTLANCRFARNAFGSGATAYLQNCSATFDRCWFDDGYTAGADCSGVYLAGGNVVSFNACKFRNHYDVVYPGNAGGAALFINAGDQVTIKGSEFSDNRTGCFFAMGQPDGAYGGGIYNLADGTTVDDCRFIANEAHAGAAIHTWGSMTIRNSVFFDNLVHSYPVNSVVERGNTGAGVNAFGVNNQKTTTVMGCTFSRNIGEKGLGTFSTAHKIKVRNSINWGNIGTDSSVFVLKIQESGNIDEESSCIQGILTQEPGEDPPSPANFPGCIDVDPLFRDAPLGDLRLADGSPCIDSGDSSLANLPLFDLEGRPRSLYADIDMGAFEYLPESFAGEVRDGQGELQSVLGLNDGEDYAIIAIGADFSIDMDLPPLSPGNAAFAIVVFAGLPTPALSIALPFGIGPFAFTPPAIANLPGIFVLTDNLFGSPNQMLGSWPAAWSVTAVGGLPFPVTLTFQGVVVIDGVQIRSTNAAVLQVE